MQSNKWSMIEAITNAIAGYFVGVFAQMLVLPLFGIHGVSVSANMGMAAIFMVTSIIRGYLLRRLFNWLAVRRMRSQVNNEPARMQEPCQSSLSTKH